MRLELHHGEALEVLARLKTGSVGAVITDPPYGTGGWKRPGAGLGSDPRGFWTREAWDEWSLAWLPEALRVSTGPVVFFLPQERLEEALAFARSRGLPYRLLFWAKPDPRPRPQGPAYGFEPILAIRPLPGKGKDYLLASSPRPGRDGEATGHPHQKPVRVMGWLVELASRPGEVVLDPFMGSGSTGEAALRLGRGFIGVEREASWYQVAQKRLQSALLQAPLLEAPTGEG
ncbi:MAG: DNA-methyltransferase [Thermus sp.]|uniref:DNA-methyltransferase n=1 Tax=unclassified Thermus TaxID=2619321 RepID=UPI001EFB99B9|nr:site-specific DNA-methyltransferase [Thermus sp. NEB1569]ULR40166.1 site-specific DNA-methyltransferase [Thermus sp. NEB1569]